MESPDEELPTEREVKALISAASHRAPTGIRNRALIALLYCSGLRLGEALALLPGDLDLASGTVRVGGERHPRGAHVFPPALPYLEAWLAARGELAAPADTPLFCTLRGAPLADAYVRALLPRLARRAGVEKRVHALGLRDGFARRAAAGGASLEALRLQLGHVEAAATRACLGGVAAGTEERLAGIAWSLHPLETLPAPGAVRRPAPPVPEDLPRGVTVHPIELVEL